MEDSSISSTSILLNCGVGNSMMKNIGLRKVVIKNIIGYGLNLREI